MDFRTWLQEAIDQNTEMVLRKVNQSYAQRDQGHLSPPQLDAFLQDLQQRPQLVPLPSAKQEFDTKVGVRVRGPSMGDMSVIRQAQKLHPGPELQPFVQEFQQKKLQSDELLIAAYFLHAIPPWHLQPILQTAHMLRQKNQLELGFRTTPYVGDTAVPHFAQFAELVKDANQNYRYQLAHKTLSRPLTSTAPIATSTDGSITIYLGDDHRKCVSHGKGTPWCISSKSSPQWYYTYRFMHQQTQYFIVDRNQQPPADLVNAGVAPEGEYSEWVDRRNEPNEIEGFRSVDDYIRYLDGHFDGKIHQILKPTPLSPQEKKIKKMTEQIRDNWRIPNAAWEDPETLLLLLHMGHNISESDYYKLPPSYQDIYVSNLRKVTHGVEAHHLLTHPQVLRQWAKAQDQAETYMPDALFRVLWGAGQPLWAVQQLHRADPALLRFLLPERLMLYKEPLEITESKKLLEVGLYLDQHYQHGLIWKFLQATMEHTPVDIFTRNCLWIRKHKEPWTDDDTIELVKLIKALDKRVTDRYGWTASPQGVLLNKLLGKQPLSARVRRELRQLGILFNP